MRIIQSCWDAQQIDANTVSLKSTGVYYGSMDGGLFLKSSKCSDTKIVVVAMPDALESSLYDAERHIPLGSGGLSISADLVLKIRKGNNKNHVEGDIERASNLKVVGSGL